MSGRVSVKSGFGSAKSDSCRATDCIRSLKQSILSNHTHATPYFGFERLTLYVCGIFP